MELLAKYETEDLQSIESNDNVLEKYNLPNSLIEFLKGDKLKIEDKYCKFIRFYPYQYTVEMKWKRKKYCHWWQKLIITVLSI